MKKVFLFLLSLLFLTATAEEIQTVDAPLIHAEEALLFVDISPVIRFQTDETGIFAVVITEPLASSEELPISEKPPVAFILTTTITDHSITYTLTPYRPEGESN